jgi:hypothetical protein
MGIWSIFSESVSKPFNASPKLMQFSAMKTAFVSQVYSYRNDTPTILQLLVYWLASSSNGTIESTFDVPQVSKPSTPMRLT